ncbi:MAG: N-acetylmuramoyl-L-alanine amidase [Nitrospirae bacterium]|nr:N-acetylmuramoyl-L-alanine amidase [Nitrospirota bacterium]
MFIVFILTLSTCVYGEAADQIVMRFSDKNDFLRFVFQSANESLINSSAVSEVSKVVKIDFPGNFSFEGVPLPEPLKLTQKDNSIYLSITNLMKIKVSRYTGPPRLVIDAYVTDASLTAQSTALAQNNETAELKILLDAGHGGFDTGMISGQFKESALTLSVCSDLAKRIGGRVRSVAITRKDDTTLSLAERLIDIRKNRPDLFISIHVSASGAFAIYTSSLPTVMSGPDMAYGTAYAQAAYIEKSRALSKAVGGAFYDKFRMQTVFREMPIPILSGTAAPAVMIEIPNPASFTYNGDSINSISDAIIQAVSDYAKK